MEPYFNQGRDVYGQPVVNVHIDRSLPERVLSMLRDILIVVVLVLALYFGISASMKLDSLSDQAATDTFTTVKLEPEPCR